MGPFDGVMEKAAFEIRRAGNPAKPNLQGVAVAPLQDSNRANSLAAQLRKLPRVVTQAGKRNADIWGKPNMIRSTLKYGSR
jgi:hypothetical protein